MVFIYWRIKLNNSAISMRVGLLSSFSRGKIMILTLSPQNID